MESIKKPQKLICHARSLTGKGCAVVGVKSGVTEDGKRAAASHTGAIATNDRVVAALFQKAGIIRVKSKVELIDVACVLSAIRGDLKGDRICILTDAGGPGVMLSDECNRQGLELPVLDQRTRERLKEVLPPESPVGNPIDCLPTRSGDQFKAIFRILEEEEKDHIDVLAVVTSNSMLRDNWDTYLEIINGMEQCKIPIIPVLSPATTGRALIEKFKSYEKPYFHDEVPIGSALGRVVKRPKLFESLQEIENYHKEIIDELMGDVKNVLAPDLVRGILEGAGFKYPLQAEVFDKAVLKAACDKVGFPLVMKVIGPLHKSDVGGVRIGIGDYFEAGRSWDELIKKKDASGVILQNMVAGAEVILGASREGDFGHLIMFGIGGVYTEVFQDVRFALAPLAKEECLNMIHGIKGFPILKGVRGGKGMSVDLLCDYLLRLSLLVTDFPQIKEVDVNPVKGFDSELFAVDARIILD